MKLHLPIFVLLAACGLIFAADVTSAVAETDVAMQKNITLPESSNLPAFAAAIGWSSKDMSEGVVGNPRSIAEMCLEMEWQGFFAGTETLYNFTDDNGYDNDIAEWKYYLGYSHTFEDIPAVGAIALSGAWTYTDVSRASEDDTRELELGICLDELFLAPELVATWDYENDTWWLMASLNHSCEITEKLTWETMLAIHWGDNKWTGYDRAGMTTAVLATGPSYALTPNINLNAAITCGQAMNSKMRQLLRQDEFNNAGNIAFSLGMEFCF